MPPFVSIIVPCYNEEATILQLLDAVLAQTYPHSQMEIIIADAFSQDQTREQINLFQRDHEDLSLRILDNERRNIPAALNLAIKESRGEIIIRLDAHSQPNPEYVERCVHALEEGKGANVGGVWEIHPGGKGWIAESIAVAASHPLGVGDAMYRLNPKAGAVDTVPFGAFRRELIDQIGGFDETLFTNEDYEFNTRVRQSGGVVWLDPQIRSIYFRACLVSRIGPSILAIRFLEVENAQTLYKHHPLAAGASAIIHCKLDCVGGFILLVFLLPVGFYPLKLFSIFLF